MTVKRARKILGEELVDLSDNEVQEMINRDMQFCDAILDVIMNSDESILTTNEKLN
jgi:hypothetical protein